jgi:tetratricopeptide (TPR) repeat protein
LTGRHAKQRAGFALALLACWISIVPFGAASPPRLSTRALNPFAEAQGDLRRGDLSSALRATEEGLRLAPRSITGLNLLGIILARQGRQEESLAAFRRALAIDPRSVKTHNNLGALYFSEGRLDLAAAEFRATLRVQPADHVANYNLGSILLARHEASGALRYLGRVQPPDAATQFDLVQAYLLSGQAAKALALARSLSASFPRDVRVHFSLGVVLAGARHYNAAIHELELANALRPGTFPILHSLGEAYLRNHDYAKADAALQQVLALKPNSVDSLYLEARVYDAEKKVIPACRLLFRARKLAPKNTDIILLLARLSMERSYFEDAIPLLKEGIRIAPRRPDLRAALGESYFSAGKLPKAYQQFQELLRLDPSASSYAFMGTYYRDVGQYGPAVTYLTEGLRKDPRNCQCLYNLGLIAEKEGDYVKAARWLARALKASPGMGDALFEMASVDIHEHREAAAIPLLQHCIQIDPDQPKAYYKLAVAERDLHQVAAATRDFKTFETLAKNPRPGPMPFQHFFASVGEKVSLTPEQQALADVAELKREIKAHPGRPKNWYLLGESYLGLGRFPEALQALQQLRQLSGGDPRTLTGAGVLLARYRLFPPAIQYFQQALVSDPSSQNAIYDLADCYFETRDYIDALRWLQRMTPREQSAPGVVALLADTEAHLGHLHHAEALFREAVQESPDADRNYLSLALIQLRAGDLVAAKQTLALGQTRIPDSGRIFWGEGVLAMVEGTSAKAQEDFQRALSLMPEWENSYSALGTLYFDTGQIAKAREILERYARIFPHGDLDVNAVQRALARASHAQVSVPSSVSVSTRRQFLALALMLADRNP